MRNCIFCDNVADSNEHAWPVWLLSAVSSGQGGTIYSERDGKPALKWSGTVPSVEVRCTCEDCNNGWMSALEDEAKPLLLPLIGGQTVELDAAQQIALASWSLKTAMVFDCTRQRGTTYFSREERARLVRTRTRGGLVLPLPPTTVVWLAAYGGALNLATHASVLRGIGETRPSGRQVATEGHAATISAGAFVAQVLSVRFPPGAASREEVFHDAYGAAWERAIVQIWPLLGGRVRWPPQVRLDDENMSLNDFALRWPACSTMARRKEP